MGGGEAFALRLDMAGAIRAAGALTWRDLGRGPQTARPEMFGDVVLARKDAPTSYHLAVTVDDALQDVTLVTRGEDLFEASHIHRLLQALLDLPRPDYLHHPLVTDESGRRLAKRDDARSIRHFREQGRSPAEVLAMVTARGPATALAEYSERALHLAPLHPTTRAWVGWVPGGLAVASVFATAGFAAVSGASRDS